VRGRGSVLGAWKMPRGGVGRVIRGPVPLLPLAALFGFITLVSVAFLVVHAFRRSLGTGMMVLLVPCYVLVYASSKFEHPRKNLILAGFFGGAVLAGVFLGMGAHALAQVVFQPPPPPIF
jgi:translocator protein